MERNDVAEGAGAEGGVARAEVALAVARRLHGLVVGRGGAHAQELRRAVPSARLRLDAAADAVVVSAVDDAAVQAAVEAVEALLDREAPGWRAPQARAEALIASRLVGRLVGPRGAGLEALRRRCGPAGAHLRFSLPPPQATADDRQALVVVEGPAPAVAAAAALLEQFAAGTWQPLAGTGQPLAGTWQPLAGTGQPLAGTGQPLAAAPLAAAPLAATPLAAAPLAAAPLAATPLAATPADVAEEEVPVRLLGRVVGKGGANVAALEAESGARILVPPRPATGAGPGTGTGTGGAAVARVRLEGSAAAVAAARAALRRLVAAEAEAEAEAEGLYARGRASMEGHAGRMSAAFAAAAEAHARGDGAAARALADEGHRSRLAMLKAKHRAAASIFKAKNKETLARGEVDLHGLHVDEALALTELMLARLRKLGFGEARVITGKGLHSDGAARLGPQVERLLRSRRATFRKEEGAFLVQL